MKVESTEKSVKIVGISDKFTLRGRERTIALVIDGETRIVKLDQNLTSEDDIRAFCKKYAETHRAAKVRVDPLEALVNVELDSK